MQSDTTELSTESSLPRFFYTFDEIGMIEDCPGLYSVLCYYEGGFSVIDAGQSDDLKSAVENNGRKELWHQNCAGTTLVLVSYTYDMKESERKQLELEIREQSGLPKGKE